MNVYPQKTENNRPLTNKQIKDNLPRLKSELEGYDKIITLGNAAASALTLLRFDFLAMPHPSGLCHFWNDKEASRLKIEELRKYIEK
jgi:uracil-DNA glycosylase